MRERLIELIKESFDKPKYEFYTGGRNCAKGYVSAKTIADYLLDNGVIIPPCAVGDTVYYISGIHNTLIKSAKVEEVYYNGDAFALHVYGLTYFTLQDDEFFLIKEEAEAKLEELKGKANEL